MQSSNLFNADKRKGGFLKQFTDIDQILVGEKTKVISKIYKALLKEYTADELIRKQMIK